jgi:GNAT superfamily N-acetyltransferase
MTIEIREHRLGGAIDDFVRFPNELFADDPAYIAPLELEVRDRLNPKKNPFFEHAEATLFTAVRDGRVVGRCSAQIDREHLRLHGDDAGFFGFLDTIDDQEVATALLRAAESWLRGRGVRVVRGPFSLSINEEAGCLVDGFEHPPVMMMPHHRRHQGALIEGAGYAKCKDLISWRYVVEQPPPRAKRAWAAIDAMPEVAFRSVDKRNMQDEVEKVVEIFNDAWQHNWGFIPATPAEVRKMAEDMKLLLDENIAFFATIDGREVACCVCLPNLNEATRDLGGKLFPFGAFKLLYRLKVKPPKSARLLILGIRTELRGKKRYGALSTAMYAELARRGIENGYEWAELGWTLEDNHPINLGIKAMRGTPRKRYRVYERRLDIGDEKGT